MNPHLGICLFSACIGLLIGLLGLWAHGMDPHRTKDIDERDGWAIVLIGGGVAWLLLWGMFELVSFLPRPTP